MRKLPKQLNKNGFTYKLVNRHLNERTQRSVVLYSVHSQKTDQILSYETFIVPIRKKDVTTPTGTIVPAGERFPGNEEFGKSVKGDHCGGVNGKVNAYSKYNQLITYLIHKK